MIDVYPLIVWASALTATPGKSIYLESVEGASPETFRVTFEGEWRRRGQRFTLVLDHSEAKWKLTFSDNRHAQSLVSLPSTFTPLAVGSTSITTVPGSNRIMVRILFGQPVPECFENGQDVLPTVLIYFENSSFVSAEVKLFKECSTKYESMRAIRRGNSVSLEM
jgi:hypothetical protein